MKGAACRRGARVLLGSERQVESRRLIGVSFFLPIIPFWIRRIGTLLMEATNLDLSSDYPDLCFVSVTCENCFEIWYEIHGRVIMTSMANVLLRGMLSKVSSQAAILAPWNLLRLPPDIELRWLMTNF